MVQSQELTEFYNAYNEWLNTGAPETHSTFSRSCGLCENLFNYYNRACADKARNRTLDELHSQFMGNGLSAGLPFSDGPDHHYHIESIRRTCHLNPKRILWVQEHING